MKIVVGSKNPVKIAAVADRAMQVWPACKVVGADVPSGVANMPMSEAECILGAKNRALAALSELDVDLGVGLEGGVMEMPEGLMLVGWVAILDRDGRVGLGSSPRIPLPEKIAERVRQGEELGPVMDSVINEVNTKQKGGAAGILSAGLTDRKEVFAVAVAYALSPFVAPHFYE